jgi:hypothetical protein
LSDPKVATVLPPRARQALVAAANIEPGKGRTESQERTNALDHTIRSIKDQYPTYFKQRGE